jgi:hypothetical protein
LDSFVATTKIINGNHRSDGGDHCDVQKVHCVKFSVIATIPINVRGIATRFMGQFITGKKGIDPLFLSGDWWIRNVSVISSFESIEFSKVVHTNKWPLYDLGVSCGGRFCSAHLIRTVWK